MEGVCGVPTRCIERVPSVYGRQPVGISLEWLTRPRTRGSRAKLKVGGSFDEGLIA